MMASPTTTLLRYVRNAVIAAHPVPEVVGVDEFALLRGRRYGTIIVDLQRYRGPIELLPERSAEALSAWLKERPSIRIISRDRSTEYENVVSKKALLRLRRSWTAGIC
jgi:transposase